MKLTFYNSERRRKEGGDDRDHENDKNEGKFPVIISYVLLSARCLWQLIEIKVSKLGSLFILHKLNLFLLRFLLDDDDGDDGEK